MRAIMARINRYYAGEDWPFEESGVGISLEGVPNDIGAFLDLLHSESCSPPAARRILAELEAGLIKRTTLVSSLNFNGLGDRLAALGVRMRVIPPKQPAVPIAVDAEVLARHVGHKHTRMESKDLEALVVSRQVQFDNSMKARPHDFGPFEWFRNVT
jgi:hypothetical protein